MKVFLTGGRGLVGRNILEHGGIASHEVVAPARAQLDLGDFDAISAFLADFQPDMVIHAAGTVGGIQANIREPVSFLVQNLDVGRNVIMAAREAGVPRLINLGSSCMYPRDHDGLLSEDMLMTGQLEPTNEGYALAKLVSMRLCQYIMRESDSFAYKTMIPCNLYGRHDKFDPAHSHLIPSIIYKTTEAIRTGEQTIEIWGTGEARREFMYAGDLADAIVYALNHFDTMPDVLNIGIGADHSVNEYYHAVARVLGYEGRFVHDLDRPVGMARKLLDVSRQQQWGWSARHTLDEGIAKTSQYFTENQ